MSINKTKAFVEKRIRAAGTNKKRKRRSRIRKGWFDGIWCDSGWELAYILYCKHHNIKLIRNTNSFSYIYRGKTKNYYPDFLIEGTNQYVEVKGKINKMWEAKKKYFPHPLQTLYSTEMKPILQFVIGRYGEQFWKLLDKSKPRPHPSKSVK